LLEERTNRRSVERLRARQLERKSPCFFQRWEVEAVRKLAGSRFHVAARHLEITKFLLHFGHREEGCPASLVIGQQSGQKVAGQSQRWGVALRDGCGDPYVNRILELRQRVQRVLPVDLGDIAQIGELAGVGRTDGEAFGTPDGFNDVVGSERWSHGPSIVHGHVRHVQIPGRRSEHHRDDPCIARNAANAPNVAHVEHAAKVFSE
jgi:hypothetical protein